jgi:phosphoadenosine phosphosulfate reductase
MQLDMESGLPIDQLAINMIRHVDDIFRFDGRSELPLYMANSGGVDSTVTADLVERAGVPYVHHHHVTGLDAPETMRFIRQRWPDMIYDHSPVTFWQYAAKNSLPLRKQKWCCALLKHHYGDGLVTLGVRADESNGRADYPMIKQDDGIKDREVYRFYPILRWSRKDVWQYIDERKLPHNPLYYDDGKRVPNRRIGCLLCPNNSGQPLAWQMAKWPRYVERYRAVAQQYVDIRKARGTPLSQKTGDEYFAWWISKH